MKAFLTLVILTLYLNCVHSQNSHDDDIDVIKYTINLDFSEMEDLNLKGNTIIKLKPVKESIKLIKLDLLGLDIDSIIYEGNQISYNYSNSIIEMDLPESINPQDEIDINIYYHGFPVKDASGFGGFYFSGNYAFNMGVAIKDIPHNYGKSWFPCNDNFTDRASYHFFIKTKSEHIAICNGELQNTISDEETQTKTYEWFLTEQIPTYLASIAVGAYSSYDTVYNGTYKSIPVNIYIPESYVSRAAKSFENINSAISIFESKFGPYKWNRVGFAGVPFNGGAMEHATNIAIGNAYIDGTLNYESLFYHELSHHWFGDLITCSTAEDMWINEGWARYCETIFFEFMYNREKAMNYRRASHLSVLKDCNIIDNGFHALYPMNLDITYSTTVYDKGGSVVHALRGYLGDEIFFEVIRDFLEQNSFSGVSSYDLRDFINANTSINVTDFFEDWVFTGGFVHYSIDSIQTRQNGENYEVTVFIKQKLRGREKFANSNRVEISFLNKDFNINTQIMEFDGEHGKQKFTVPFDPVLILCDYNEVISDATTDISKIITTKGNIDYTNTLFRTNVIEVNEIEPVLLRITHNFVAPDGFKDKIPGLFIADNRYWTVEGNFPGSFKTNGEFYYDKSSLDNDFINNSIDSLVLLYRPDRTTDWTIEPSINSKILSRLTVSSLKQGEYSLGIYNWKAYNIELSELSKNILIYPNPNNGNFYVKVYESFEGKINIYDMLGKNVLSKNISHITEDIEIKTSNLPEKTYIIEIIDYKNNSSIKEKIIIQK